MVSPAVSPPKKILVICPICQGRGEIHVPDEVLQDNKGTSTVLVRAGVTCNHLYQAFVDKNCKVRGYQRTDYEVPIISKQVPAQQLFEGQNAHNPVTTPGSTGSPRGGESEITIALREFITKIDGFLSCNLCSRSMAELYDLILARKGFHVVRNDMKNWINQLRYGYAWDTKARETLKKRAECWLEKLS